MDTSYEDLKIGDTIKVINSRLNPRIRKKKGTIICKNSIGISVFFHENINGHQGWNSKKTYEYRKVLAEKYIVPIDNCWNFDKILYGKYITVLGTKIDIKFDLYELAKI